MDRSSQIYGEKFPCSETELILYVNFEQVIGKSIRGVCRYEMLLTLPTLNTFRASSHTCIPLESNTSTHPRYLTANVQVPVLKTQIVNIST